MRTELDIWLIVCSLDSKTRKMVNLLTLVKRHSSLFWVLTELVIWAITDLRASRGFAAAVLTYIIMDYQ